MKGLSLLPSSDVSPANKLICLSRLKCLHWFIILNSKQVVRRIIFYSKKNLRRKCFILNVFCVNTFASLKAGIIIISDLTCLELWIFSDNSRWWWEGEWRRSGYWRGCGKPGATGRESGRAADAQSCCPS